MPEPRDLTDQLRAWTDRAAVGDDRRVRADEVLDRPRTELAAPALAPDGPSPTARRRWLVAAALLVAAGAVAAVAAHGGDRSPTRTSTDPTTTSSLPREGDVRTRVVYDDRGSFGALRPDSVVTSPRALRRLWRTAHLMTAVPAIDFTKEVVVAQGSTGCGGIVGVHRKGDLVTPRWEPGPSRVCAGSPTGVTVLALDRRDLGDRFRFRQATWDALGPEPPGYTLAVVLPDRPHQEVPSTLPPTTTLPQVSQARKHALCAGLDAASAPADLVAFKFHRLVVTQLPTGYRPVGATYRTRYHVNRPRSIFDLAYNQLLVGPSGQTIVVTVPIGAEGGVGVAASFDLDADDTVAVPRCGDPVPAHRVAVARTGGRITASYVADGSLRFVVVGAAGASRSDVLATVAAFTDATHGH